jgi:hypothetical protein
MENYLPLHYDYLQFAYFQSEQHPPTAPYFYLLRFDCLQFTHFQSKGWKYRRRSAL